MTTMHMLDTAGADIAYDVDDPLPPPTDAHRVRLAVAPWAERTAEEQERFGGRASG
jgi:hypothetical protein